MPSQQPPTTGAIAAMERHDIDKIRQLTMEQRSELLASTCRTAAEIENSRRRMGFPPLQQAPWPESTWTFLAECARRAQQR